MIYTIWSNAGKWEWILYRGDNIVARSYLVFPTRRVAQRDIAAYLKRRELEANEADV